jgi:thiol-disulfide isomerase/thioredoxin
MKRWQLLMVAGVLALLAGFAGYQLQQYLNTDENSVQVVDIKNPVTPEEIIGTTPDDFSLLDVNGEQRYLSEWQGNVIVINFWATWCAPCREEIPAFIELQNQYAEDGIQFIGIALQQAEDVLEFMEEFNVNYPSLVGGDEVIQIANKLGNTIGALPYTVIIDRGGQIAFTRRGPLSKSDAEIVIQGLL